ncbi:MAG: hypothetical protein F6K63_35235 [Moorea sp. SIO1G6]|nr:MULTISPECIES: hypothetical protein [unclassified Moorena]NEQ07749.1 hypothetical protein [Moorena sp. SIO4E2]NET69356.1 hypothetical protein [Moorena sp. SIO1G6]
MPVVVAEVSAQVRPLPFDMINDREIENFVDSQVNCLGFWEVASRAIRI